MECRNGRRHRGWNGAMQKGTRCLIGGLRFFNMEDGLIMKPFLTFLCASLPAVVGFAAERMGPLPQTRPLDWEEADLSARLMDGAHRFVERKIAEAPGKRAAFWTRDFSSPEAYAKSVQPNRERLREFIGAVDTRLPAAMERYGDDRWPALVAETPRYRVFQVRWPVLEGLWGSGLLVQPKGATVARVVVLPDADQTPEQLLGLAAGIAPDAAGRAAAGGEWVRADSCPRPSAARN